MKSIEMEFLNLLARLMEVHLEQYVLTSAQVYLVVKPMMFNCVEFETNKKSLEQNEFFF